MQTCRDQSLIRLLIVPDPWRDAEEMLRSTTVILPFLMKFISLFSIFRERGGAIGIIHSVHPSVGVDIYNCIAYQEPSILPATLRGLAYDGQ
jgi:hypothetical protein